MKILNVSVTNKVTILNKEEIGSGNVNTIKCVFSLPSNFDGLIAIATFKKDNSVYNKTILNNECYVPHEVLATKGYIWLGVYGYSLEDEVLSLRESPLITGFSIEQGSYMGAGSTETAEELSDYDIYIAAMNQIKEQTQEIVDNFNAEDVTFEDGETFQEKYESGELTGPAGEHGQAGETGSAGPQGQTGERGPAGTVIQANEPEDDSVIWVDTDEDGEVIDINTAVNTALNNSNTPFYVVEITDIENDSPTLMNELGPTLKLMREEFIAGKFPMLCLRYLSTNANDNSITALYTVSGFYFNTEQDMVFDLESTFGYCSGGGGSASYNQIQSMKNVIDTRVDVETGDITSINIIQTTSTTNYLALGRNYSTPFIPTQAGDPATKKYVDDCISALRTELGG